MSIDNQENDENSPLTASNKPSTPPLANLSNGNRAEDSFKTAVETAASTPSEPPPEPPPESLAEPLAESALKLEPSLSKIRHHQPRPWRPRGLVLMRYFCPPHIHRPITRVARRLQNMLETNSGDWHWMANRPMPLKALNRNLWRSADPSFNYFMMLFLSGVISALGLLAGSTAAIIGAMIVAPLMGPIIAMSFSIAMGNRRLLKRSLFSVISGILLTVATAYLICSAVGLNALNSEILERTRPTLIDLAIGLAAGAAGAFAQTRRGVADALPGVAIAVALVPPLSVVGIGLAAENNDVVIGSTLLFLTNLAGIFLSGGLVFIWQDYGSLKRARQGLTTSTIILALLGIPLGFSMRDLIIEERARSSISSIIRQETLTFRNTDIRRLTVDSGGKILRVDLEVAAPENSISETQINLVHEFLESKLERSLDLRVSVFPLQEFSVIRTVEGPVLMRENTSQP